MGWTVMNYKLQESYGLDDCGVLCSPVRFRRLKGRAFDARVRDRAYEKLLSDLLLLSADGVATDRADHADRVDVADVATLVASENDFAREFTPSRRELVPSLRQASPGFQMS